MQAIIVEDSRLARKELKHLLEAIPEIELLGEAANADEAVALIEAQQPDLLFLDIQLPGKDGFQLLAELGVTPLVIFTTAYDQYALKAFEVNALDYLQKPIQEDRLLAAIKKASIQLATRPPKVAKPKSLPEEVEWLDPNSQVFVKDGDHCWFVTLTDIRLFEIDGSYTRIHFSGKSPMIPKTLNQLEARLDPNVFFRANRQQIVNLRTIEKIEPWFSGGLKLTLIHGDEVEVSRRQASRFKELTSL